MPLNLRSLQRRHLAVGAFVAGALLIDLFLAAVIDTSDDVTAFLALGMMTAQITMLAVWTALSPAGLFLRTSSGFLLASLGCLAMAVFMSRNGGGDGAVVIGGALFVQWLAVQIPLWLIRLPFGWRLSWPGEARAEPTRQETQFGIRQLLAWTTMAAVVLAAARLVTPSDALDGSDDNLRENIAIFVIFSTCNALFAAPIIWATLVRRWMPAWLVVALFFCGGLTIAEGIAFKAAMGGGGDEEVFWMINAVQFFAISGVLLMFRFLGFRLICASAPSTVSEAWQTPTPYE